jgi:RNA polymerase sigma-70 factor (ECF subfamily)
MDADRETPEERFRAVFAHLGALTAYARRRGSPDPAGIAAEAMTIAWRRLDNVPVDDPLPWLYATARNLVWAEARRAARSAATKGAAADRVDAPELFELDPAMGRALRALAPIEREALLLVAWEELTPKQAAQALSVSGPAFRVRLLRARRRIRTLLQAEESSTSPHPLPDMETT